MLTRLTGLVRGVGRRHRLAEHEIDELFQAVRLRLWRARGSSEQIATAPTSYVYRTAITAAIDLIRARRHDKEDDIELVSEAADQSRATAQQLVEAGELGATVARAIEEITASRRPVVRMYLAGYDQDEIADLMGWSAAKTRNLLYRGLADLRAVLLSWGVGPEIVP